MEVLRGCDCWPDYSIDIPTMKMSGRRNGHGHTARVQNEVLYLSPQNADGNKYMVDTASLRFTLSLSPERRNTYFFHMLSISSSVFPFVSGTMLYIVT